MIRNLDQLQKLNVMQNEYDEELCGYTCAQTCSVTSVQTTKITDEQAS